LRGSFSSWNGISSTFGNTESSVVGHFRLNSSVNSSFNSIIKHFGSDEDEFLVDFRRKDLVEDFDHADLSSEVFDLGFSHDSHLDTLESLSVTVDIEGDFSLGSEVSVDQEGEGIEAIFGLSVVDQELNDELFVDGHHPVRVENVLSSSLFEDELFVFVDLESPAVEVHESLRRTGEGGHEGVHGNLVGARCYLGKSASVSDDVVRVVLNFLFLELQSGSFFGGRQVEHGIGVGVEVRAGNHGVAFSLNESEESGGSLSGFFGLFVLLLLHFGVGVFDSGFNADRQSKSFGRQVGEGSLFPGGEEFDHFQGSAGHSSHGERSRLRGSCEQRVDCSLR